MQNNEDGRAMGKSVVMVIAFENFRDEELFDTKKALEDAGINVTVASISKGVAHGMLGATYNVETTIDEINPDNYDTVVFVGGSGASIYYENKKAHDIARAFFSSGKPVAAICIAPGILAKAGILSGKKATIWNGNGQFAKLIEVGGGTYINQNVVVDGNIITANGPHAAKQFGEIIANALK